MSIGLDYLFLIVVAVVVFITKVYICWCEFNGQTFNYKGDGGNYS